MDHVVQQLVDRMAAHLVRPAVLEDRHFGLVAYSAHDEPVDDVPEPDEGGVGDAGCCPLFVRGIVDDDGAKSAHFASVGGTHDGTSGWRGGAPGSGLEGGAVGHVTPVPPM